MRLKFDRLINITIESRNTMTVPEGELWRYSIAVGGYTNFKINNTQLSEGLYNGQASGGCRLEVDGYSVAVQAIVFKVVKEE